MANIPTPDEFVNMFKKQEQQRIVRFAKIDSNYTNGKPKLIFDGEDVATIKRYPFLDSYDPVAGDRVMLIKNVIVGKVIT